MTSIQNGSYFWLKTNYRVYLCCLEFFSHGHKSCLCCDICAKSCDCDSYDVHRQKHYYKDFFCQSCYLWLLHSQAKFVGSAAALDCSAITYAYTWIGNAHSSRTIAYMRAIIKFLSYSSMILVSPDYSVDTKSQATPD